MLRTYGQAVGRRAGGVVSGVITLAGILVWLADVFPRWGIALVIVGLLLLNVTQYRIWRAAELQRRIPRDTLTLDRIDVNLTIDEAGVIVRAAPKLSFANNCDESIDYAVRAIRGITGGQDFDQTRFQTLEGHIGPRKLHEFHLPRVDGPGMHQPGVVGGSTEVSIEWGATGTRQQWAADFTVSWEASPAATGHIDTRWLNLKPPRYYSSDSPSASPS